ncbi:hypothetical protein HPB50_002652 [Hyalomma asiaticum]|uniref:Uncharacterized protein n=1 Tax=Hyalomma asiaticum TaxID=266040 RepID=A0ACB7THI9_HYAAI|nr:hypothetical protein HPB50_002652 [Hyalomma asiaticum]
MNIEPTVENNKGRRKARPETINEMGTVLSITNALYGTARGPNGQGRDCVLRARFRVMKDGGYGIGAVHWCAPTQPQTEENSGVPVSRKKRTPRLRLPFDTSDLPDMPLVKMADFAPRALMTKSA